MKYSAYTGSCNVLNFLKVVEILMLASLNYYIYFFDDVQSWYQNYTLIVNYKITNKS